MLGATRKDGHLVLIGPCGPDYLFFGPDVTVYGAYEYLPHLKWHPISDGTAYVRKSGRVWMNGYPLGQFDDIWTSSSTVWRDPLPEENVHVGVIGGPRWSWGDVTEGMLLLPNGKIVNRSTASDYGLCNEDPVLKDFVFPT